jgi:hypothetical protein
MSRDACRNCGDPIAEDASGWFHTRLPLKDGQTDTNPPPCRAAPGGKVHRPPQGDLFEVTT